MYQVVTALVKSRSDMLSELLNSVVPAMAAMIQYERSEVVKATFLSCLDRVARAVVRREGKQSGGALGASFGDAMSDVLDTIIKFATGTGSISSDKANTVISFYKLLSNLGKTTGWQLLIDKFELLVPSFEFVLLNENANAACKVSCLDFLKQLLFNASESKACLSDAAASLLTLLQKTVPQGWDVSRAGLEAAGALAQYCSGECAVHLHRLVFDKVSVCVILIVCDFD